ncbi:chromate reductase [Catalinimonas alkaloidigena]|uniref:NADPH-dependent FMN reductase n=1 Tax=Catalinimonas alkaloidigena TaxID=1075417 RepID=UPI0024064187|nr:NADPH-dependent FMN reductase [Catalinimonas alkaloidigena]MDF9801246.1 chromate reductase [Catalinimonas alkaloidigena]
MITIVVGTNRKKALSAAIAAYYQKVLQEKGTESQVINLVDLPADFTATALYENNGKNNQFNRFRQVFKEHEKFVFIIPEYNGSYPGVLKAFIDGMDYPSGLQGKKCALVGLSSGVQGASIPLSHFTDVLHYLGMHVLALKVKMGEIHRYIKENQLTSKVYDETLRLQADQLIAF